VSPAPPFTDKQGQYLAFIYAYSRIFRQPPAEADMQRHFQVSPPSVHQMVLTLERAGLIRRTPGVARSIEISGRARGPPSPPLSLKPSKPLCNGTRREQTASPSKQVRRRSPQSSTPRQDWNQQ
jgi:LexA DNA binding domain